MILKSNRRYTFEKVVMLAVVTNYDQRQRKLYLITSSIISFARLFKRAKESVCDANSLTLLNHMVNAFKRKLRNTAHFSWILNITEEENGSFASLQRLKQKNPPISL